jgi:exonuclease SbcD
VDVVGICLDEQVDALLLSGDLYDGEQTSMKTARFLADQLGRLQEANISVFIIRGNHDALSRITKELSLPDVVKTFGGHAGFVQVSRSRGEMPVAIHGISFAQPHAPESLLARFKPPVQGSVNIGMLHTSLSGSPGHNPYAPCELADLHQAGFQYWALGHIHRRSVAKGASLVVMPGMPQGRDIGEPGPKSVTIATVMDDGSIMVEERHTSIAQFERVTVNLDGVSEWKDMIAAVARALGQARNAAESEHLVARLNFTGATRLAWRLRRDPDLLRTEAENQAAGLGKSWIDKIEINCQPLNVSSTTLAPGNADPLDELRRLMGEMAQNETYRSEIQTMAEDLRSQLPSECRLSLGGDEGEFIANLGEAAREGIDDVLAYLRSGTDDETSL